MRTLRILPLITVFITAPAWADDSAFFVQLGSAPSESEASGKWKALQAQYPKQLEHLQYAPSTVAAMGGGASEFRVQAGPTKNREEAKRICNTLMKKNVECFIVETATFDGEPAAKAANDSGFTVVDGPQAKARDDAKRVTESGDLPWLGRAQAAEVPANKGQVNVAEAIPVPLSSGNARSEAKAIAAPPPVKGVQPAAAIQSPQVAWLQIYGFNSEQAAFHFFESLREHLGEQSVLQVRIVQPMHLRNQTTRAELDIGPVPLSKVADVCGFAVQYGGGLRCVQNAVAEQVTDSGQPAVPHNALPRISLSGPIKGKSVITNKFYVQLGAMPSKAKAIARWEELKAENAELLSSLKPDIRPPAKASLNAKPTMRLRVGPFAEPDEAESLCDKLTTNKVDCLVVPE